MFISRSTGAFMVAAMLLMAPVNGTPETPPALQRLPSTGRDPVNLHFQPGLETVARELREIAPVVLRELEGELGLTPGPPVEVVVLNDSKAFAGLIPGGEEFTGFASAGQGRIVLDARKLAGSPFGIRETFRHELAHILLHRKVRGRALPRWLNEGLAQLLSGGVTELLTASKGNVLREATVRDRLIPFSRLSSGFPRDPDLLHLAYSQSLSMISYIEGKFGRAALIVILDELGRGQTVDQALRSATGSGLRELESAWRTRQGGPAVWFAYLGDRVYWILFFGASVLTLWGFVRLRRRMRRIEDEWEREEQEKLEDEKSGGPG